MSLSFVIARKEIRDHLRDTRALLSSAFMALMGPAVVLLVSLSDRAPGQNGARVFVGMLSIFALVSAFAGAIDVAMDSTAGERERRSLIPLLLDPVTRSEIILGKWIAVTAFALAAVALNSAALVAVLAWAAPAMLAARAGQIAMWILLGLLPSHGSRCGREPLRRGAVPDDEGGAHGAEIPCVRADADRNVSRILSVVDRPRLVRAADRRPADAHRAARAVGTDCGQRDTRARDARGRDRAACRRDPRAEPR